MSGKTSKGITLHWRDENYGRVHAAQAFRYGATDPAGHFSDTAHARLGRLFRRHGFHFNSSRASWIAEGRPADAPSALAEALSEAGYAVRHTGCVPDVLSGARTTDAGSGPEAEPDAAARPAP